MAQTGQYYLSPLGGIFLLGEKIQKNLDAWIAVAQRVVKLFDWLKAKYGLARVDESGALAIAINDTRGDLLARRGLAPEI